MNERRVAGELLFLAKELVGIDFPTQDAMDKYLKDHPDADKTNHRVVETKRETPKKEGPKKRDVKKLDPKNKGDRKKVVHQAIKELGEAAEEFAGKKDGERFTDYIWSRMSEIESESPDEYDLKMVEDQIGDAMDDINMGAEDQKTMWEGLHPIIKRHRDNGFV